MLHQKVEQQGDRDEENHLLAGFYEKALVWVRDEDCDKPAGKQNLQAGDQGVEDGDAQGRAGWLEALHFTDPA